MTTGHLSSDELERVLSRALTGTNVHLSDIFLSDKGCERLCELLEKDSRVTTLVLRGNDIQSKGLAALAHLIRHHKQLTKLCLQWNPIGSDLSSFMTFMDAVAVNRSLTSLDLRNCKLTADAGNPIGQMLSRNTTLKQLDLRWNLIEAEGSVPIQSGLECNGTLVEILISGNDIPVDIITSLSERCHQNRSRQRSPSPIKSPFRSYSAASVLDESFRFSQDRLDTLRGENTNLKIEIADLQGQLEAKSGVEKQLSDLKVQFENAERDWQAKHKVKQDELDNVQLLLNESSMRSQALQSELEQCNQQIERHSMDSKREEQHEAQMRESLTAEIAALNQQLESERSLAAERLQHAQTQLNEDLDRAIADMDRIEKLQKEEKIRYEGELEDLKSEMDLRSKQANSTIEKLTEDCNQKSRELADLHEKHTQHMIESDDNFKRLQQQASDQHQHELALKTSVFENRILQLEATRDELQKRLSGTQLECDRFRDQIEQNRIKHEHEIQLERIERSNTEFQLKSVQNESNRKESEMASLNTEIRRLKDEIRSITTRAETEMEASIASKNRKIDDLVERLGSKDDHIDRLSRDLQHLEDAARQIRDDSDKRNAMIRSAMLGLRDVFESEIVKEDFPPASSVQPKSRKSRIENRPKKLAHGYYRTNGDFVVNK